jgi:hypothetical protein
MPQLIEGYYRDGKVSLDRLPEGVSEVRVRVEFVNEPNNQRRRGVAHFGIFAPSDGKYTTNTKRSN